MIFVKIAIRQCKIIKELISFYKSRFEKRFYSLRQGFKSIHAEHLYRLSMFANTNERSHAKVFHYKNAILAFSTYHGELCSSVTAGE